MFMLSFSPVLTRKLLSINCRLHQDLAGRRIHDVPPGALWVDGAESAALGGDSAAAVSLSFGTVPAGLTRGRVRYVLCRGVSAVFPKDDQLTDAHVPPP